MDSTDLPNWDKTAVLLACCLLREGVIIALPRTRRQQHSSALQTPGESTQEKPACLVPGINGQCKTGDRILEYIFFIVQKAHEGLLIGHSPSWFQTENPWLYRGLLRPGSEEPHSQMAPILPPLCLCSLYLTVSLYLWVVAVIFFTLCPWVSPQLTLCTLEVLNKFCLQLYFFHLLTLTRTVLSNSLTAFSQQNWHCGLATDS